MTNSLLLDIFLLFVVLSIVAPVIQRWRLRRMVRESIGLERICRKADLELRELTFDVLGSLKYSDGRRLIRVAFSFEHRKSGVSGNGWVRLDPVEVWTMSANGNSAVEASVAKSIENVRSHYAGML